MNSEIFLSRPLVWKMLRQDQMKTGKTRSAESELDKAFDQAFIRVYMKTPRFLDDFPKKEVNLARGVSFHEWIEAIDIRDYFEDEGLLRRLLRGLSAEDVKFLLRNVMKSYYDTWRTLDLKYWDKEDEDGHNSLRDDECDDCNDCLYFGKSCSGRSDEEDEDDSSDIEIEDPEDGDEDEEAEDENEADKTDDEDTVKIGKGLAKEGKGDYDEDKEWIKHFPELVKSYIALADKYDQMLSQKEKKNEDKSN